jgi:hypothetical protein
VNRQGWEKIGPGCFVATDGEFHIFADELLIESGYEPTEANLEMVRKMAHEAFAEKSPRTKIKEHGFFARDRGDG